MKQKSGLQPPEKNFHSFSNIFAVKTSHTLIKCSIFVVIFHTGVNFSVVLDRNFAQLLVQQ